MSTSTPLSRLLIRLGGVAFACLAALSQSFAMEALSISPAWVQKNTTPASAVSTIRGIGFLPGVTVTFDGAAATTTFVDSRTLTVQAPLSAVGKIARVVVVNPGGATDDLYPFIYTDKIVYVSTTGDDGNSGLTPALAKRTIRGAIDEVPMSPAAPTALIRVSEGRFGDNALPLPNAAVLAGGYDLTFTQRNPDIYVSVVDSNRFNLGLRSFGLDAKVIVDGLTFLDGLREGPGGGAIEFIGDQVVLTNSVVVGNTASGMGGGVYLGFSTSYGGRASLSNNVIIGNRSYGGAGGGVVVYPLYSLGNSVEVAITDNYIAGNRSLYSRGGGISFSTNAFYGYDQASLKLAGNMILGNSAKAGAGLDVNLQVHSNAVDLMADNNVIAFNSSAGDGGGVTAAGLGMLNGSLTSSTIASNTAGPGGGAGLTFGAGVTVSPAFTARDLIIWGNVADDSMGPMSLAFSDVGTGGLSGPGNISVDPRFRKGLRGRFYLAQNDPNTPTSAAVDSGSGTSADAGLTQLTTSIDSAPDAGILDMGAHYEPPPADSPVPISLLRIDPPVGEPSGTDWVLLRGQGFDPGARVFFGTPEATTTVYISSTRILAQPPVHGPGFVNVTVTNPDLSSVTLNQSYGYVDTMPPVWQTTVGAQAAQSPLDCSRSVIVDWNQADDAMTPPVRYEIHRFACTPAVPASPPCVEYFEVFPSAASLVGTTSELSFLDTTVSQSGSTDPWYIYIVRAADSHNPSNKDYNYSKRVGIARRNASDTTPPAAVGQTLELPGGSLLDWAFSRGALSYRVYRQTTASSYATPATLTPLVTLTAANNDLDGDGAVDTRYNDPAVPLPGQVYFYKVSALDPCNVETRTADLAP